jgi:(p)ppGpp synthase/HD superfamily hydrolase
VNLIIQAAHFARIAHDGQMRKYTGRPYIEHPMRVAGMATLDNFASKTFVAAAWLHDVIEDCPKFADDLFVCFPLAVSELVRELTNPSHGSKLRRAERKALDREHLSHASIEAKRLKLMDRIDNIRDMAGSPDDFKRLYIQETRQLIDVLDCGEVNGLVQQLSDELGCLLATTEPSP